MDRYKGKPFLRLIECYVLDSIDQLDNEQRDKLREMEPKLAEVYNSNGSWREIVSAQMDFPESLPEQIRNIWSNYLVQAKAQGASVDPNEFARSFVDQNFSE